MIPQDDTKSAGGLAQYFGSSPSRGDGPRRHIYRTAEPAHVDQPLYPRLHHGVGVLYQRRLQASVMGPQRVKGRVLECEFERDVPPGAQLVQRVIRRGRLLLAPWRRSRCSLARSSGAAFMSAGKMRPELPTKVVMPGPWTTRARPADRSGAAAARCSRAARRNA